MKHRTQIRRREGYVREGIHPLVFREKRGRGIVNVVVVLALLLSALTVSAEPFVYTDKLGRTVKVDVPVKRAVILQVYELIPVLGLWNSVVGISTNAHDADTIKATRPDSARAIASTGSGGDFNIEVLLKLKPDLVLTWTHKPDAVRFMEQKGLNVIGVSPDNLTELYEMMDLCGKLFGKEAKVAATVAEMDKVFALVKERISRVPPQSRRKALWITAKPTTVSCGAGVASDMIRMSGCINPASDLGPNLTNVSMEQIVAWNPDVVFIWGFAHYTASTILDSPQWRFVKAVQQGAVYKAPKWSVWSPRMAPEVLWMAARTYPQVFQDVNLKQIIDDFYRNVYGVPYEKVTQIEE